jgi:hypothetical protein
MIATFILELGEPYAASGGEQIKKGKANFDSALVL